MGYIAEITSPETDSFPGALFEAKGDIPAAECTEAKIEGTDATTSSFERILLDESRFTGYDLTGKTCHILQSTGGNTGNFTIASNGNDYLALVQQCGNGTAVKYYVSDGPELQLTRDVKSLAEFISTNGYAYTFKNGKLYTDMPNPQLAEACSILWNPLP